MSKNDSHIEIKKSHIDRTFPFHFAMSKNGSIVFFGPGFKKLIGDVKGKSFTDLFLIERPRATQFHFKKITQSQQKAFLLKRKSTNPTLFRGQFEYFKDNDLLLFLGSPWFSSI